VHPYLYSTSQKAKEKDLEERERMQANEKLMRQGKEFPAADEGTGCMKLMVVFNLTGKRPRLKPKEDLPRPTKSMQQRETPLELDKNLNQTMVVANPGGRGPSQPGFYCDVCKRNYKDTSAYLDHINSRSRMRHRYYDRISTNCSTNL
jgi:U4/U6.U5 tri-snRNP component SNU23